MIQITEGHFDRKTDVLWRAIQGPVCEAKEFSEQVIEVLAKNHLKAQDVLNLSTADTLVIVFPTPQKLMG